MEWTDEMIRQCGKPSGELGRLVGQRMNDDHIELWEWGLSHISIDSSYTVLDIGCGGGKALKLLASIASNGKLYGIDYSREMTALASKVNESLITSGQVTILHGSVSSLPFPADTFDLAAAFETYYFWLDLTNALKEIKRVLKPGGKLLLVNEIYKDPKFEERNSRLVKLLNMRYNTPEEFREFLSDAGYGSIEILTAPEKNWITAAAVNKMY